MKQVSERLYMLIEPVVVGMGYEAVGIEFDQHRRILRVYIDHPDGITVHDCSDVSYQVSGVLDVEEPISGHYNLEVSSPGLDRPLFKLEHFVQFVGSEVRVHLRQAIDGRRNFKGLLLSSDGGQVTINVDGESYTIPYDSIETARLVPDFKAAAKGKRHGE
ncbi:MAG: ribosome maturation factor RimP [Methylococcaceae bacterium]|nr:MAG: ribosome maturation factor RimP [Methylococcaceae bacterium]